VVVPNSMGFTASKIPDETIVGLEQNGNSTYYTVKSKPIADYVSKGSNSDLFSPTKSDKKLSSGNKP